jgi:anhydro-N-acetylmuramic acid kinase
VPLPENLRQSLLAAKDAGVPALARADLELGRFQAEAVASGRRRSRLGELDLVGSHGQTAYHEHRVTTLQIGEPACIAQALDCAVVADFRRGDVAAGGSGAPLVPLFDQLFLAREDATVMALNIGGIANFTVLPGGWRRADRHGLRPGQHDRRRPGQAADGGRLDYDRDGALAANRRIDEALLERLAARPSCRRRRPARSVARSSATRLSTR